MPMHESEQAFENALRVLIEWADLKSTVDSTFILMGIAREAISDLSAKHPSDHMASALEHLDRARDGWIEHWNNWNA